MRQYKSWEEFEPVVKRIQTGLALGWRPKEMLTYRLLLPLGGEVRLIVCEPVGGDGERIWMLQKFDTDGERQRLWRCSCKIGYHLWERKTDEV